MATRAELIDGRYIYNGQTRPPDKHCEAVDAHAGSRLLKHQGMMPASTADDKFASFRAG